MDASRFSRLLAALGVALALAVGLYLLFFSGQERHPTTPAAAAATVVPGPTNGQVNYPHLTSKQFPQGASSGTAATPEDVPCGGNCACGPAADRCQAGRTCTAAQCDSPLDKKRWRLRLGGLKTKDEPPNGLDGDTTVCVSRTGKGAPYCASLRVTKGDKCGGGQGLEASTDELLDPGLDIVIRSPQGKVMARGTGLAYKFLNQRELCNGLRFGGTKFSGTTDIERVWFYLDEV
jgi:hypothetical protein